MRVSFVTLLPTIICLASWAAGIAQANQGQNHHHPGSHYSRDLLDYDELDFGLERREFLEELSTRELLDELTDRLERRGNTISKAKEAIKPKKKYGCPYCGAKYDTPELAKACATKPQILGGCKVMGAVRH